MAATKNPSARTGTPAAPSDYGLDIRGIMRGHRTLAVFGFAMAVLALVFAAGMVLDGRTLVNEPIWLKPMKFAVSFALYALTLAWMFGRFPRWRRTLWLLGTVLMAAMALEMGAIALQAWRGTRSHFNFATPFDTVVNKLMGAGAMALIVGTLLVGVFLLWQRRVDRPLAWAIRIGILLVLAGMAFGPLMLQPTADQLATVHGAGPAATQGAHTVGAADGGETMPVTGWNTEKGDLRIGHFIGLHGVQALPLFALLLAALAPRVALLRAESTRVALVIVAGAGYGGTIAILGWQALRGQALIDPDAATLSAMGAVLAATVLGAGVVLAVARAMGRRAAAPSAPPGV